MDVRGKSYTSQGRLNLWRQAATETKFCTVAPNICRFSGWTCFMSPFQHLQFCGVSYIFGTFSYPWANVLMKITKIANRKVRLKLDGKYILRHKITTYFCVFSLWIFMKVVGGETLTPWTLYSTWNLTTTENDSPDDKYRENYRNFVYNYVGLTPKKTDNIQQNGGEINHIK
jgi:hypothetical protein